MAKVVKTTVLGLDMAAAKSGYALVAVKFIKKDPYVSTKVLAEGGLRSPLKDGAKGRSAVVDVVFELVEKHGVEVIAIEDYALRISSTNTSAYQHAEVGGMVRREAILRGIPVITTPPTTMRHFVGVKNKQKDKGKNDIIEFAKERYGFESQARNIPDRSNATDAFVHAVIGALAFFAYLSKIEVEALGEKEIDLLTGGSKLAGLLNMKHTFMNFEDLEKPNGEED